MANEKEKDSIYEADPNALTLEQFHEISVRIREKHSFGHHKHQPWVKYIRPQIDMRTAEIFSIKFEGAFDAKEFNDRSGVPMYQLITEWLDEEANAKT